MTVPKPMPTTDNTPKIRHFDFYTDEFHHYPVDIPQNCLDVIDKNIALDADNVFAKIGDVLKTAILLFADTLMLPQPLPPSLAVAEVVQPQVGDVTRTRMNCLGRIAAL